MEPTLISFLVFLITFVGSLLGLYLSNKLPKEYLQEDSRRSINLTLGLVSTITALIMGLVTASTKESFDYMDKAVRSSEIKLLTLDRILRDYGPETVQLRKDLKASVGRIVETNALKSRSEELVLHSTIFESLDNLIDDIRKLQPKDSYHQSLYGQAMSIGNDLLESRWFALNSVGSSVPNLFMGILIFWLFIIFTGFGLTSPRNRLVVFMFLLGAFAVSSGIFLILELDGAFDGIICISSEPMHLTYRLLGVDH